MTHAELNRRFDHHPPPNEKVAHAHETIRAKCKDLGQVISEIVPEGREQSLAFTKLEEVMMWANAGIARNAV